MTQTTICTPLLAQSLTDQQMHVLIEHQVPRLEQGFQIVGNGVFLAVGGELAETITAMIDFELRALQRLRAQALHTAEPTARQ